MVSGTVTAVNGSTITLVSVKKSATTTYTIDASNARIVKSGDATTTLSDIVIGSKLLVRGSIIGTSVLAQTISTPKMAHAPKGFHPEFNGIVGVVSSVNGASLMVTTTTKNSNTTYTVDASNAKISKGFPRKSANQESLTNIQVGDTIIVRGTVNGTSVIAKSIIENLPSKL